jgi:glycyl-tRNA synthetase beta chain
MAHFVMEVGTEEMPARFIPGLIRELEEGFGSMLSGKGLGYGKLRAAATPRRLSVMIDDLDPLQRTEERVVTGPPAAVAFDSEGNPTKAGLGFARSQQAEVGELFLQETPKGDYVAVRRTFGGSSAQSLLPEICTRVITGLSFPKRMHWNASGVLFGRPIRWLLALLDQEEVPFELAGLSSGRTTHGHRVMGPGPFEIGHASDYLGILSREGAVVLDPEERRGVVRERGTELASNQGGTVVWKEGLLEEVVNLVEHPDPVLGGFDRSYLALPREVLLTSMETHQKSFGVAGSDGELLPFFLTTLNIRPSDPAIVRRGWERVLRARLEDARFFWETDLKAGMDEWLARLDQVIFLGPLGSMGAKARRLAALTDHLAGAVAPGLKVELTRAALLAKADLVSEMVGEFSDLQGIMGGIYAREQGETETVSRAIYEQYLPAGPESPVPASMGGALLAIADKCDTLVGCFGLNMVPTGAHDPYGLRRQALGIIRIVLEHGLRIDLGRLVERALTLYSGVVWKNTPAETRKLVLEFIGQRLRPHFQAEGYETRQVDAAMGAGFTDLRTLKLRLAALDRFSRAPGFEDAVLTFKRAANIIRKQGQEEGVPLTGEVREDLLLEDAERELARRLAETGPLFALHFEQEDFDRLFALLGELRGLVDRFFDTVMVMTEERELRLNRLNLLQGLVTMLGKLADFSALQV